MTILSVNGLSAGYGKVVVLDGVSLEVGENQPVSILGPNGAGKTTLLRTIAGIHEPTGGSIVFDGKDITKLPAHLRVKMGLALLPEGRKIFTEMSVMENLLLGGYLIDDKSILKERLENVFELFPVLKTKEKQIAGMLSGGQQQMLSFSRALMTGPKLLILDEPSAGLAPKIIDQIYDVIVQLSKQGVATLIVEQAATHILSVSDFTYVMARGKIVLSTPSKKLGDSPDILSAYFG